MTKSQHSEEHISLTFKQRALNGALKALIRFSFGAIPISIWLAASLYKVVPIHTTEIVNIALAAIVFIAGLPLSAILMVDTLSLSNSNISQELILALALVIATINILLLGAVWGMIKKTTPTKKVSGK